MMSYSTGGIRDGWRFKYSAKDLKKGAEAQKEFRLSRVTWWTEQRDILMAQVREKGIVVTESVGSKAGNAMANYTQSHGPQISIDPELQKKLNECHSKIQKHQEAAAEYDGWVQVLGACDPAETRKLTQADWLYFFGKI